MPMTVFLQVGYYESMELEKKLLHLGNGKESRPSSKLRSLFVPLFSADCKLSGKALMLKSILDDVSLRAPVITHPTASCQK